MKLPKAITDKLAMSGWKKQNDYNFTKDGVLLSIYRSSMGRMYKVGFETPTMSGNDLIHIDRLYRIIEGKQKPNE